MTTTNPKSVLITGATSGIGRHAALHLARQGYRVFASGRRVAALESLEAQAKAEAISLETLRLDVTDPESIEAARVTLRKAVGSLDVLINNAGYGHLGPTSLVSDEDMRKQFETNVFGLMAVTRAFLPQMKEAGSGRVINVSSVGGRMTFPFFGVYNATKYAVESLSDALRYELAPFGVDVVLVEPGVIDTGFADVSMDLASQYKDDHGYGPVLARADELRAQSDKMAVKPIVVSKAIHKAIASKRPRARYVAPFSYSFLLGAVDVLPTRLVDWAMRQSAGLTRGRLKAAA